MGAQSLLRVNLSPEEMKNDLDKIITETRLLKYIENCTSKKTENFQKKKKSDNFQTSARRGGSNEYLQSMFWAEIRKIKYTPVNTSFLYKSGV